jgi:hypothetical protein
MGLEVWGLQDWTGCPALSGNDGDIGPYLGGYEFPEPTESVHVGGGWYQSYWEFDFSEDGSVYTGDDEMDFPLDDASHTTAIIGMSDGGAEDYQIEEVYINYIWFSESDRSDIPTEDCESIVIVRKRALIVETTDLPVYEDDPCDPCLPDPQGPTSGTLDVKLAYKPGEDLGYPNFNVTVVADPDPNQENVGNPDFAFPDSTEPNDNVTLTFTQANWDTFQHITVEAIDDDDREGNESYNVLFTVTIDIDDPNFGSDPEQPVTQKRGVLVVDNDIPWISALPKDPCSPLKGTLSENNPGVDVCLAVRLSHIPDYNVQVRASLESDFELIYETVIMDPNFEDWTDPNHLLFTPSTYRTTQDICLKTIDDDEYPEGGGTERIPGQIYLNGTSKDVRYEAESEEGDGELAEMSVSFDVQDNDCGAWGYDALDTNEDCVIDLGEIAAMFTQWQECTEPYDPCDVCSKIWEEGGEEEE